MARTALLVIALVACVQCSRRAPAADAETSPAMTADPRAGDGPQGRGVRIRFFDKPMAVPAFAIPGLDGKIISTADWRGKVVLVNFWATWCGPCRAEIPALVELQARYRGRLLVIGVSVDEGPPADVRQFALNYHINYPVVIADDKLEADYGGIRSVPSTFIINTSGGIVQEHRGMLNPDASEQEVRSLLGLPTEAAVELVKDRQALSENAASATEIPGVDLKVLSPTQRQEALRRLNLEKCTCGCGLTLAQCRIDDPSCDISLPAAQKLVKNLK